MKTSTAVSRPGAPSPQLKTTPAFKSNGPTRSDSAAQAALLAHRLQNLRERVLAELVDSGYAALSWIGCEVDQNRVILRGSVPSYHLKQLAQVYAQRVDGIVRVDNRLEVRGLRSR